MGGVDEDSLLLKEKWHRKEQLLYEEGEYFNHRLVASLYDGYPILSWSDSTISCVVEGVVFNIPESRIRTMISEIARSFSIKMVEDFVREADGDFVVCVHNNDSKKTLFFNDELGGLPFNYYYEDNLFVSGRNASFIATVSGKKDFSKENLAELLCFNYNMAGRTVFESIKSFTPAMYLLCEEKNDSLFVSKGSTVKRSYDLINPYKTKEEAIEALKELFIEGTRIRCDYAKSHGYSIVNTMSGGFDSRTVLGGIEACIPSEDYLNLTYEFYKDESIVATKVLEAVGSRSDYVKLSYNNTPNLYDSEISFKTEGKIATYTNSLCYNDLSFSYDNFLKGKRVLYFGGFGGEFIRHPLFAHIWNASNIGYKTNPYNPNLNNTSRLCRVSYKKTKRLVESSFELCNNSEAFCKMFYDEYYRNYVRGAGEERIRMFYFSVQPLMSKPFILAIRNRVPLSWVGYEFYTAFLEKINPALIKVEIHGGKPNIFSKRSLRRSDYENKSYLHNILRRVAVVTNMKKNVSTGMLFEKLDKLCNIDMIFDKKFLEHHYPNYTLHVQSKIAAILFYINKLNIISV